MKKLISIILILCILFSFAACSANTSASNKEEKEKVGENKQEKAEEIYILSSSKEKYIPNDTILDRGLGITKQYMVIVNGSLFTNYELTVDDASIASVNKNANGQLEICGLANGHTVMNIDTGKTVVSFGISFDGKTVVFAEENKSNSSSNSNGTNSDSTNNINQSAKTNGHDVVYINGNVVINMNVQNLTMHHVGFKYVEKPKTDNEYINNIYFLILDKRVNFCSSLDKYDWKIGKEGYEKLFTANNALMGLFVNSGVEFCFKNNELYIVSDSLPSLPYKSSEELYNALRALEQSAYSKYKDVHQKNKFTAKTSILETIERYLGIYKPSVKEDGDDSAYGAIVNSSASELGVSAGFNCLMDLENIESYGLLVEDKNSGESHVVSYVLVDGEEYVVDVAGSNRTVIKLSDMETKLGYKAKEDYLSVVRSESKKGYFDDRQRFEESSGVKYKTLSEAGAAHGINYKEMAKVYCGNENLAYVDNPKTDDDHWNNFKFCFLTGQWDYQDIKITNKNQCVWAARNFDGSSEGDMYNICGIEPALLSAFGSGNGTYIFYYDGSSYHVTTGYAAMCFLCQPSEVHRRVVEVYKLVKSKYEEFRQKGLITASSTQYDIAKTYTDWVSSLAIDIPGAPSSRTSAPSNTVNVQLLFATAYAAIVEKTGTCLGKTAAVCLMMNMEGITSYGIGCGDLSIDQRSGHIVPWMLLDGKEYIYEYVQGYIDGVGLISVDHENAKGETSTHGFSEYKYNIILKKAGLDYDESFLSKSYQSSTGASLTKSEWQALKNK